MHRFTFHLRLTRHLIPFGHCLADITRQNRHILVAFIYKRWRNVAEVERANQNGLLPGPSARSGIETSSERSFEESLVEVDAESFEQINRCSSIDPQQSVTRRSAARHRDLYPSTTTTSFTHSRYNFDLSSMSLTHRDRGSRTQTRELHRRYRWASAGVAEQTWSL